MINKPCLRTVGWLTAGLMLFAIAGCPDLQPPSGADAEAKLVPFASPSELLSYFKQQALSQTGASRSNGLFGFGGLAAPAAAGVQEDTAGSVESTDAGSLTYSTTNIQEVGVDESDVVKSDGTYFYIARGTTLRIVRANPADELAEVGRLDLDLRVNEMYLYGSKLILLAQRYQESNSNWDYPEITIWPPYYVDSNLTAVEVDVSDPASPAVTKQVEFDGALADSRLTNERLILILTIAPRLPDNSTPLAVGLMPLEEFMPKLRSAGNEHDMVTWDDCLHPASPDGYFLTAVLTLDAADIESTLHSVAVVAGAGTIYASTEALYITDTEYNQNNNYREMTAIHKFAFDENGAAQYVASGSVPGRLLNQFSLGEHEGYLRVATHVNNPRFFGWFDDVVGVGVAETPDGDAPVDNAQSTSPPDDFNAIYVLGQSDNELEVAGTIENIAPGENLYSARFMGTRGFLVTFRRIDPLFTLDLADPTNPEIKGELKIPGYSDYLHPLGDSHLIGVGRAVVTMSSWGGEEPGAAQLSLFDVSDLSNPTLVQQIELGGIHSWSYVSYTHKAFTLMPEQGLLAMPMQLTDVGTTYSEYDLDPFRGVVCFDVDTETGFTERGRITAVDSSDDYYRLWYPGRYPWFRAAFIDNTLYAISADGVAAAPADSLEDATTIELQE